MPRGGSISNRWVGQFPAVASIKKFQENPDVDVYLKPGLKYWWIGFTVNVPPFDNLKAREAVRYALDVDELLEAVFYGVPERACTILPPGVLGYWEDAPCYEPNLVKAKELLEEAGYPDGFEVTFLTWPSEENTIIAEVVKAQLEKVGIDVNIVVNEVGAFNEATCAGRDNNFHISFFATSVDPGYAAQWFTCGQKWNLSQWCNPEYDALGKEADAEMDPQKRADLYVEMQKLIDEDCWAIWLTYGVRGVALREGVQAGKLFPNGRLAPWQMDVE